MGIREELDKVMELQADYSSLNTVAMRERGSIIKHVLPSLIGTHAEMLRSAAGITPDDFVLVGRDGIGRKSQVPWIRFASRACSPSAAVGWYVVWLFKEDGSGVYLALSHASTKNVGGDFIKRSPDEARRLLAWGRDVLGSKLWEDTRLSNEMMLGGGDLARSYESTTVASYHYAKEDLPPDSQLLDDMLSMATRLGQIYSQEPAQNRTKETSLDVISVIEVLDGITSGRNLNGQGFALTHVQRRAVELRAMLLAKQHFVKEGFSVEDTSSSHPYDLIVTKDMDSRYIEVKGTTGSLGDIVLTRNEVDHHVRSYPNNGIFIVYAIELTGGDDQPSAQGGMVFFLSPWMVEPHRLQPIAYRYRIA